MSSVRRILALVKPDRRGASASAYSFLAEKLGAFAASGIEVHTVSSYVRCRKMTREGITIHPLPRIRSIGNTLQSVRLLIDAQQRDLVAGSTLAGRIQQAATQNAIARIIRLTEVDLVYSAFGWPAGTAGLSACRVTETPIVLSLHGADVLVEPTIGYGQTLTPFGYRRLANVLSRVDHIIAMSGALAERAFLLGAPKSRVSVVLQGVDMEWFRPGARRSSRETLQLQDRPTILFVGNFVPAKGIRCLLDAYTIVRRSMPGAQLVMCGDGPDFGLVQARIREAGVKSDVILTGRVARDRISKYFRACDVFVLPSLTEGAGYVLIEAAASARPIVAASVGGIPDYVRDGLNGLLFRKADAADLAQKILRVLRDGDLARRLGHAGRLLVETHHGYARMIDEFIAIFDRVIQRRSTARQCGLKSNGS